MSAIPEDIKTIAKGVFDGWANGEPQGGHIIDRISNAILAERKRCAAIARRCAPVTQDFADAPLQDLAMRISKRIEAAQ